MCHTGRRSGAECAHKTSIHNKRDLRYLRFEITMAFYRSPHSNSYLFHCKNCRINWSLSSGLCRAGAVLRLYK